jgi:hypothetical protein
MKRSQTEADKRTKENKRSTFTEAPCWVHGFALGSFGVIMSILLVLFLLYKDTDIWFLWYGYSLPDDHVFAEAIHPGIFRTCSNSWSNMGFVFVGLYVVAFAWWDGRRTTTKHDCYAVRHPQLMGLFGMANIVVGFGSTAMHASLTPWGHLSDVFGMFFVFLSLIVLQWARWIPDVSLGGRRRPTWPVFSIAAIAGSIWLLFYGRDMVGDELILGISFLSIPLGIALDLFILKRTILQVRWLVLSSASLVLGIYIWRLDVQNAFSPPDAWWQGHAIFHLLMAVTLGAMAQFFRSEVPRRP